MDVGGLWLYAHVRFFKAEFFKEWLKNLTDEWCRHYSCHRSHVRIAPKDSQSRATEERFRKVR